LLSILIACSQPSGDDNDIHIVPILKQPKLRTESNEPPPPPPIQVYYLPSNFIIDTAGRIYFYQQQQHAWFCGTGIEWDTPPVFIDLKPKDIIQVPIENIEGFIKLNILTLDRVDRRVAIASLKDTIKSEGLSRILKVFWDSSYKVRWAFRKATQEERIVLSFKRLNRKYSSEDIKWDSAKIYFPLKVDTEIKFTPPKVKVE